jgi:hypothetical protein
MKLTFRTRSRANFYCVYIADVPTDGAVTPIFLRVWVLNDQ